MRHKRNAFTLVELLVVIGIIALLLAISMPAYHVIRTQAKTTSMKSTIASISMGLEQFKNEMGYYPGSSMGTMRTIDADGDGSGDAPGNDPDTGAHHLANAMFGIDMLGYNKNHYYYVDPATGEPSPRQELYVNAENLNVINFRRLADLDAANGTTDCVDKKVVLGLPANWDNLNPIIADDFKQNRPRAILYYRARPNKFSIVSANLAAPGDGIYNPNDNAAFWGAASDAGFFAEFASYAHNPVSSVGWGDATARPYNKDSFLLISAGPDGLYGTSDDVCNFEVKK